ncbi:hypothetical protein ABR737_00590 [Streptomyces sp. Edi2]|uniref:hypothetical protein n=1 Tax=Streptomyces sp. Edi2 TaxID=3162528 RepID=UPI00330675B5
MGDFAPPKEGKDLPANSSDAYTELPLRGFGALTVRATVLEHGRTRYVIRAPHAKGTVVVIPETPYGGPVTPRTVRVQFGDGIDNVGWYTHRVDEPVIRNVRVHGFSDSITPRTVSRRDYFLSSHAVGLRDNGVTRRIPDGARALTEAIVVAVVRAWNRRSDRADLLLAAARHAASQNLAYEQRKIEKLQSELCTVRSDRAAARRRINQVSGLVRRRQLPVQQASSETVQLPFVDRDGTPMGVLNVRETKVNTLPGRVVYSVEGGRVRGTFTVGPDIYDRSQPIPRGIYISYGRPTDSYWFRDCDQEPVVNGVQLSGGWSHGGRSGDITLTSPSSLPAQIRLGPTRSTSAPYATMRRASAALRALALHYLARPDQEALRIAAGKHSAASSRAAAREELNRLRQREATLTSALRRHRTCERQYRDLLAPRSVQPLAPVVELRPRRDGLRSAA